MSEQDGGSGRVINLKRARKAATRAREAAEAEQNRVRFGRGRSEKLEQVKTRSDAERRLDGHRRDPEG